MIMAAARMNLPSIFVSGGPMNPGRVPVSYTHLDVYKRQVQFKTFKEAVLLITA